MTYEELKRALIKADLILKPCAIICSSHYADIIKANFEKTHKIIVSELVEPDKVYVINRKQFEEV